MSDPERASIANAIWLCRTCHGIIDRDEGRFGAELLFLWKEQHERRVMLELGKPGDLVRAELEDQELADFKRFPGFTRQLVKQRPEYWEYLLTAELLTHYLAPTLRRLRDLENGAYALPSNAIADDEIADRISIWVNDLTHAVAALNRVVTVEISASWGPSGLPAVPTEINHACQLYSNAAERLLAIAENVKFSRVSTRFEPVRDLIFTAATYPIGSLSLLPEFLRNLFTDAKPTGTHKFVLEVSLPPNWSSDFDRAMRKATKRTWF